MTTSQAQYLVPDTFSQHVLENVVRLQVQVLLSHKGPLTFHCERVYLTGVCM